MAACMEGGGVLVLFNLHLSYKLVSQLVSQIEKKSSKNFKLILVTEIFELDYILIKKCFKLAYQQPISMSNLTYNLFTKSSQKLDQNLRFGLCYFHSIVVLRNELSPLGFNVFYEFSQNDL